MSYTMKEKLILYIENDLPFHEEVASIFEDYQVEIATNLNEARLKIREFSTRIDLIILNLNLKSNKDCIGLIVLDFLKDNFPGIKKVIFTGSYSADLTYNDMIKEYGVTDVFPKPINRRAFREKVCGFINENVNPESQKLKGLIISTHEDCCNHQSIKFWEELESLKDIPDEAEKEAYRQEIETRNTNTLKELEKVQKNLFIRAEDNFTEKERIKFVEEIRHMRDIVFLNG